MKKLNAPWSYIQLKVQILGALIFINDPEVNYSPTRISGEGSVSKGSITQQEKGHCFRYMD